MSLILDGSLGITTPAETVQGALTTTGNTILGDASTDTLNVGNGGLVKDASGNVGIGYASPATRLDVRAAASTITVKSTGIGSNAVLALDTSIDTQAASLLTLNINGTTTGYIGSGGATYPNLGGNNSLFFYNMANGPAVFATNGTERMRIDSSGNVLVGTTTSPPASGGCIATKGAGTSTYFTHGSNNTSGTTNFVVYNASNVGVYLIAGQTAWTANSDEKLKNVTGTYANALLDITQIKPVKFTWKADTTNTPQVGVLAQSVQSVVPESISQTKVIDGDETEYLGVRYTELIPLMIASIQELKAIVDAQAARIAALES